MSLSIFKPMDDISILNREMNRLFNSMGNRTFNEEESIDEQIWTPRANISETKDNYNIELDLPGITKEEIQINLKDNSLQIEGERKESKEEKDHNWVRQEAYYGKFFRSFILPKDVDVSKTEANFKNGVLSISLTKREESKPKQISINVK